MAPLQTVWQLLNQDTGLFSGFQSPLLSWIGAGAILTFCLWHGAWLFAGFLHIRRAFSRINASVARLLRARHTVNAEWITIPGLRKMSAPPPVESSRRDLDDLQELDRLLRAEPAFAAAWLSYRKTFSVEQPSWFIEPTVHTDRSSIEFFPLETLCVGRLDIRFYHSLPALMTGIGLTFTFLAILLGLSKLHADGSHIDGIQGLINGLAGKFLTSIVALACANAFGFMEKSLFFRLSAAHRRLISSLDEMFPQRVRDRSSSADARSYLHSLSPSGIRNDTLVHVEESMNQRLAVIVTALSDLSGSLTGLKLNDQTSSREQLASHLGRAIQEEFRPLLAPLQGAIEELTRAVERTTSHAPLAHGDIERLLEHLKQGAERQSEGQDTVPRSLLTRQGRMRALWQKPVSRGESIS
ncbi:MAG TPA: hypothetical protein VJ746_01900 [Nitrospira sp.]|nr:hypothetical protein [Nitrospira sp.]